MLTLSRRGVGLLVWACLACKAAAGVSLEAYQQWLEEEKGYSFGAVSVIADANGYRRMIATQDIEENFLLVKLPFQSSFSEQNVNSSLASLDCDDAGLEALDARSRLVVTILLENAKEESAWKPFLDQLNMEMDVPMAWGDKDMALLRGSGLQLFVQQEKDIFKREYNSLVEACPEFGSTYSMLEFLQVGGIVGAMGAGEESIFPFIDLANHDNNPNSELGGAEDEGVFALVSTKAIREGEEITQSYYATLEQASADLTSLARYGFVDDESVHKATTLFPGCIPPTLIEIAEKRMEEWGESFQGFSPELQPCCGQGIQPVEADHRADKACYAGNVRTPVPMRSFMFTLGPILADGTQGPQPEESDGKDFAEMLRRIRTLVADSGTVEKECPTAELDLMRPISMASELKVAQLLRSLMDAHLDETSWAVDGGIPGDPANKASEVHRELVRKAFLIERGVFEWYKSSVGFLEEYLTLPGTAELQQQLCARFMEKGKGKKKKSLPEGIAKYEWLVEHILAPLAFHQKTEGGEACSVNQATHKLKKKECQQVLAPRKEDGKDEL